MTVRHTHPVVVFTILLAAASAGLAADTAPKRWPRFRGPGGTAAAAAPSVPVTWTDKDYHWKITLPGTGHSSPAVWGDRVFLTCGKEETGTRIVCCVSAGDGKLLWQREYPSKTYRFHKDNSYASASPAVDAERVYARWTVPEKITLRALTHDGAEVWDRDLGPFAGPHGSGASPVVWGDTVILGNDQLGESFLIAVDAATGKTRWKTPRPSGRVSYCTPCVYRGKGEKPQLIFTSTAAGMTGVDPETGTINWKIRWDYPSSERFVASPVVAGGLVFAVTGKGGRGLHGAAVRPGSPDGTRPPKLAYALGKPMFYTATPVAAGGLLFCCTDRTEMFCLDAATGERLWRRPEREGFYSSPLLIGDRIYWITKKGTVIVTAASKELKVLGQTPLGEMTYNTPAVADGVMYLRTNTALMSLGGTQ